MIMLYKFEIYAPGNVELKKKINESAMVCWSKSKDFPELCMVLCMKK